MASAEYQRYHAQRFLASSYTSAVRGDWFCIAVLLGALSAYVRNACETGADYPPALRPPALTPANAFQRLHRPHSAILSCFISFIFVIRWRHQSWPFLFQGGGPDTALP